MGRRSYLVALSIVASLAPHVVAAELQVHGFAQGNYAARVTDQQASELGGGDFILGEERVRLDLASQSDQAGTVIKVDLLHDAVTDESDLEVREAYIDYIDVRYDIRLGRQIITWGVGDLLFINDAFPKDWVAFYSGRPTEYLKVGVDGMRLNVYSSLVNVEAVVVPFFEADRLPTTTRFVFFDPFADISNRTTRKPRAELENTELAFRMFRYVGNWDTALYVYRGFWRQPGIRQTSPIALEFIFPKLAVYGASAQAGIFGGVVSAEGGYYDSVDDRSGDDTVVPNSLIKYLLGYQRQLWTDFTVGLQYYGESMRRYGAYRRSVPVGFLPQDRLRKLLSLRLTQLLKYQTLRLSLFVFFGPADREYFINPEVRYSFTDALWGVVGTNIIGGDDQKGPFGQFRQNDNVYLTVRYEF